MPVIVYSTKMGTRHVMIDRDAVRVNPYSFTAILDYALPELFSPLSMSEKYSTLIDTYLDAPLYIQEMVAKGKSHFGKNVKVGKLWINIQIDSEVEDGEYHFHGRMRPIKKSHLEYTFHVTGSNLRKLRDIITRNPISILSGDVIEGYMDIETPYVIYTDNFWNILVGILFP